MDHICPYMAIYGPYMTVNEPYMVHIWPYMGHICLCLAMHGPCTCHMITGVFNTVSGGIGRALVTMDGTGHVYAGSGPPAQAGALPMASGSVRVVAPNVVRTPGSRRCLDRIVCVHHRTDLCATARLPTGFRRLRPSSRVTTSRYSRIHVFCSQRSR